MDDPFLGGECLIAVCKIVNANASLPVPPQAPIRYFAFCEPELRELLIA
jgi:hypothetical protein